MVEPSGMREICRIKRLGAVPGAVLGISPNLTTLVRPSRRDAFDFARRSIMELRGRTDAVAKD